ncbi:myosin B [Plasmodium berghei]|uniref:Myosin-A n=2 Tax=Plasmodium berghei TaxID=5821 RepID=A0A509ALJ1_PLABA|nr:myosin B [Plasmodium berghei ANKA]CXI59592.1 myosin B [Plasmodium berghei]SCM23477.1 myosin B [Plasmodium berghei]SCN26610.1 myosin B [Plasmodium berghei]SCO60876.1 myosin B [Plasmodium berghei]SCO62880.1 myosin B [Plasmodium berghei]|eukprot:XP_034422242.1 myosin B [Plasmodium berghei ANKA]
MKNANELSDYLRVNSEFVDKSKNGFEGGNFYIWTHKSPNATLYPDVVFFKCLVLSVDGQNYRVKETIPETNSEYVVKKEDLFNCNSIINVDNHRLNDMIHHNSAEVLNMLCLRYKKNYIYTIAEPMLISINPYQVIDVDINEYKNKNTNELPPHVYSYAKEAMADFINTHTNQSIIISGESGSGKTEASKLVIKYYLSGIKEDNEISNTLWDSNFILEAFGNAKTLKNNNSSRYGKYIKIELNEYQNIVSSSIEIFLLENIRVVSQEEEERGYHIFYQIFNGMSQELKNKYKIRSENEYKYIVNKNVVIPEIDDSKDFGNLMISFDKMKMHDMKGDMFLTLSGLLLLGNVEYKEIEKGGKTNCSELDETNLELVNEISNLLGINYENLKDCLVFTEKTIANQKIEIPLSVEESVSICKSISKDLYNKIFSYITKRINNFLNNNKELNNYIGILDIFGFEIFSKNSLEQLLINIANEEIHSIYLYIVYEKETELYKAEDILIESVKYTTNESIIDLLRGKTSIVSILEDSCLGPVKNDESIISVYTNKFSKHAKYASTKRDINKNFVIKHTVSDVTYTITNFISKNKDILPSNIVRLLKVSNNNLVRSLYADVEVSESLGRKNLITFKYLKNLNNIISYLKSTNIYFIKCIKPNENKEKNNFNQKKVFPQLFALSIIETLNISFFFQYKYKFDVFLSYFEYLDYSTSKDSNLTDKEKVSTILQNTVDPDLYKVGKSMIFLKKECVSKIREIINNNLKCYKNLCNIATAIVTRIKKKEVVELNIKNLQLAQAYFRKYKHMKELE